MEKKQIDVQTEATKTEDFAMRYILPLFFCFIFIVPAANATSPAPANEKNHHENITGEFEERIETDVIRYQKSATQIYETLDALKREKTSYIQELTASPNNVRNYRTKKSQRQMVGVYWFDMSYAAVFDRKKQSKESGEALQLLLKSLGFSSQNVNQQYQRLIKESQSVTLQTLTTNFDDVLNNHFRAIAESDEGATLIGEAAYGWLIEGLYVTSEIVAQKDYSPMMLYLINEHAESIPPVVGLMESVGSNPKLSKLISNTEQLAVLAAISATLKDSDSISKKEIDAVRGIVSKARAAIIN